MYRLSLYVFEHLFILSIGILSLEKSNVNTPCKKLILFFLNKLR